METELTNNKKNFQIIPKGRHTVPSSAPLGTGRILLGRTESCDFIIPHDSISAVHAVLEIFNDRAIIYDMNSTHGSFVNNQKVIVKEIRPGEIFRLGDLEFEFALFSADNMPFPEKNELVITTNESQSLMGTPVLPSSAPSVISKVPKIVHPLTTDPRAEFSEYIFEDIDELYPIFNYGPTKHAVEVIILFNDQIFSVDYVIESKDMYLISGVMDTSKELEFPYLGRSEKIPFLQVNADSAIVHTLPGFEVYFLGDQKRNNRHQKSEIELYFQEILRLKKGDLQIFIRNVQAPPEILPAPILKRDPDFRKYLGLLLFLALFFSVGINLIDVPEEKKNEDSAPERLAQILYKQKLTISENPLIDKTKSTKSVPQKAPDKVVVEKNKSSQDNKNVPAPDVVDIKSDSSRPDPGKPNLADKNIVKKGSVSTPSSGGAKNVSTPTSSSSANRSSTPAPTISKSTGHVDVYKSMDFKSSVNSLISKSGSLSKMKTGTFSTSASDLSAAGSGVGLKAGSGEIKTATISTNQGSLIGATTGSFVESKGAEGLSAKKAIYTAGIPSETIVLGSMDPDLIRRRLMEFLPQFRSCYQKELEVRGMDLNGTIRLNFVIGSSGHVSKAGIDGPTALPRDVSGCVLSVLRGITFPEPLGGGTVEVKQPMNFRSKRI